MSLINDALKKAQRQRSADSSASLPAVSTAQPPAGKVSKRAKPIAFSSQVARLVATALGVGLVLVGGVLYWQWKSFTPGPLNVATAKVPAKTPALAAESKPTVQLALPNPTKDSGGLTAPLFTVPVVAPTAQVSIVAPTTQAPEVKVAVAEPAPILPAAKAGPDPKILAFVDTLRVTGIRAAGNDSKVLMNDRVYRVNDVVDHALGLKLTGVAANALTFEDGRGVVYSRNF